MKANLDVKMHDRVPISHDSAAPGIITLKTDVRCLIKLLRGRRRRTCCQVESAKILMSWADVFAIVGREVETILKHAMLPVRSVTL